MAGDTKNIDQQRMLDAAMAFFLAGERNKYLLRFDKYDFHSLGAPTITNFALSVEVALKLLALIETGKSPHGHEIKSLFEQLPANTRDRMLHTAEVADDINKYFEDWRYPYEKDFLMGSEDGPRRAFIECYREIRLARPTLKSVFEKNWGGFEPDWIESHVSDNPRFEMRLVVNDD